MHLFEEKMLFVANAIIATPGRLMHLLSEVPGFGLSQCAYVVFDEADRLFELGFAEQLHAILGKVPESRQTLLFSATMPRILVQFARAGLHDPELVRVDSEVCGSPPAARPPRALSAH